MWVTYPRSLKYLYRLVFVNHTKSYYVVLKAYPLIHRAYYYGIIFFYLNKDSHSNIEAVDKWISEQRRISYLKALLIRNKR